VPVVVGHPESPQAQAFRRVAEEVARQVSIEAMKPELVVLRNLSKMTWLISILQSKIEK